MHFIDVPTHQNPALGPIDEYYCIGTIPEYVLWSQSCHYLCRKLGAYYCIKKIKLFLTVLTKIFLDLL